jgi:oxygen-dependent protoporphyrinogen oxidase
MRIAVIGAGIAGLAAAHRLMDAHDVTVFEREPEAGGKIRSQHIGEFLFEWGPGGFLSNAEHMRALVHEVGLDDALIEAGPAAKNRYIFWNGKLHKLPSKPPEIVAFSLLSPFAKVRAMRELTVRPRVASATDDETVYAFMERRFGRDVAERIVAPALLGVSGGDAKTTGIGAVFPRVVEFERVNGSVIRGMVRGARTPGKLTTFTAGGMQRLTDRIAERVGDRLRTGARVERIERRASGWRIVHDGTATDVDGVIVTTPSAVAADLVTAFDEPLAAKLRTIAYAPMRSIGVAFRAADMPNALDGFGFLAARGSGVRILGATYTSTIVPDQAPPETAYVRVFMGGAVDPDAGALDAERVRAIVLADLARVLGVVAAPIAYHEIVWPQAIPQYTVTHRATVAAIESLASAHPYLALAGNAYRGLGVGDTVRDARAVADAFG